jgi:hypothetical protein
MLSIAILQDPLKSGGNRGHRLGCVSLRSVSYPQWPSQTPRFRTVKPGAKAKRLFDSGGLYLEVGPRREQVVATEVSLRWQGKRLSLGVYPDISLPQRLCFSIGTVCAAARSSHTAKTNRQFGWARTGALDTAAQTVVAGCKPDALQPNHWDRQRPQAEDHRRPLARRADAGVSGSLSGDCRPRLDGAGQT